MVRLSKFSKLIGAVSLISVFSLNSSLYAGKCKLQNCNTKKSGQMTCIFNNVAEVVSTMGCVLAAATGDNKTQVALGEGELKGEVESGKKEQVITDPKVIEAIKANAELGT